MGVRGLNTLFDQNPEFLKPFKLHDTLVVIDGSNLIHSLYFTNKINVVCGGDYNKYADVIRKYLLVFLQCRITPIVILDGGYDRSGRKLKRVRERMQLRLTQVTGVTRNRSYYERVLPILAKDVFISILIELTIPFAMCDYEADDQITTLANYYQCPVISADSDFYIYNVHKGFIRLDSIDTTVVTDTDSDGKEYRFLNCNIYHIEEFVSCFPGIDKKVLPLFSTLSGNDYVEAHVFKTFFSNVKLPKYKGRRLALNEKQKKMVGLLCWLKDNTLEKAIEHVMRCLKKDQHQYVRSVIADAVKGYELNSCHLSDLIDKKIKDFDCRIGSDGKLNTLDSTIKSDGLSKNSVYAIVYGSKLMTPCGASLPNEFVLKYHSGYYSSFYVNVIVLHKVYLAAQIENIACASSYVCSRYVRQIIYGILVQHLTLDVVKCKNEKCVSFVEEIGRQQSDLQKERVEPVFSLDNFGKLPCIDQLRSLKEEDCKLIFTETFGVNRDFVSKVPENWQLLVISINYFLRHCEPHCSSAFIYGLIMNLIFLSVIKGNNIQHLSNCCDGKSCKEQCMKCILSNLPKTEISAAEPKLKKYLQKPTINNAHPLILHILHSYSQLQSCITSAMSLNKLLNECFRNPELHTCFSGTMIYNLTNDIAARSYPLLFVGEILGRHSSLFALFMAIDRQIREGVRSSHISNLKEPLRKSKKKSNRSMRTVESAHYSGNKFDALNEVHFLA